MVLMIGSRIFNPTNQVTATVQDISVLVADEEDRITNGSCWAMFRVKTEQGDLLFLSVGQIKTEGWVKAADNVFPGKHEEIKTDER